MCAWRGDGKKSNACAEKTTASKYSVPCWRRADLIHINLLPANGVFLRHATTANNTLVLYKNQKAPLPPRLDHLRGVADALQFTLVDCPGHASLIRTVIGGAQIIDLAVLVVDATKGACLFFVVLCFGSRRLVFFGLV